MTLRPLLSACLTAAALGLGAQADTATTQTQSPVLAELFTSQSCSSCPAAEEAFNTLAQSEGVVAIQWHVDYWDMLVHGRAGKWKDPFSSAANTRRQRDYNYALLGTPSVYTPQAVVAGVSETVGSRERTVQRMIQSAPAAEAAIAFNKDASGQTISVTPQAETSAMNAEIILVTLLAHDETNIAGGENKGRRASSRNIAVAADTLGAWTGKQETYRAETMPTGYTCAVIVQEPNKGRVLGAAYCPP